MTLEITQPLPSQLNGSANAFMHEYDHSIVNTPRRAQVEYENVHAHVHEYRIVAPKPVIETDKEARVHVRWTMDGDMTPFITGMWHVSAFLEMTNAGDAPLRMPLTPCEAIPLTPQVGPVDYEAWVKIPANTVMTTVAAQPYKLVVAVAYYAPADQPAPLPGFMETLGFPSHFVLVTTLTYGTPTSHADPVPNFVEGSVLQFYIIA